MIRASRSFRGTFTSVYTPYLTRASHTVTHARASHHVSPAQPHQMVLTAEISYTQSLQPLYASR